MVVDVPGRGLRKAAVQLLLTLDRRGALSSAHVQLSAETLGVAERTVWRWSGWALRLRRDVRRQGSYTALVNSGISAEHPAGFEFDFSYWFDCDCGRRVEVTAGEYEQQCGGDEESYPVCECGDSIDISTARPALRDLDDIDCHDDQVDRHLWYHTSPYQDWPSPRYRSDITALIKRSLLSPSEHEKAIEGRTSLALHLGTYAAAVENMLRRMHDQDSPTHRYWLHQVQVQLGATDLAPGVRGELSTWLGDVPMTALTDLGARAVRYVNTHESPGSISLAIDATVIVRVRTIPLPPAASALPATEAGEQAVTRAVAALTAAQQLRPDTTGIPEEEIFESELDLVIAQMRGRIVDDEAVQRANEFASQFEESRNQEHEALSSLRAELAEIYLPNVNPQLRTRVDDAIAVGTAPGEYHLRLRQLAALIAQPHQVLRYFDNAPWRKFDPPSRLTS
ncbi:hypothetical protein [Nocardia farcinica]|uniref:hypothetical protein n=1 Tax=Nocardia farcinica TaxID=37329 RepID=UPI002B4B7D2F|nr:hypothetical protein [Nocardia farcinica]